MSETVAILNAYARDLETRVAKLEEVIQTQNGVVVSGTLKLNEARARVAQLEEELRLARMHPYGAALTRTKPQ